MSRGTLFGRVDSNLSFGRAIATGLLLLTLSGVAGEVRGQAAGVGRPGEAPVAAPWPEIRPGSQLEEYLRALQILGISEPYPWSIRGFSPLEMERIAPPDTARHPWAARFDLGRSSFEEDGFRLVAPRAGMVANTSYPFGSNDGPLWAGRGMTFDASGGAGFRWGPVSASLQPVVFWAQNADFSEGARRPTLDAPVRFGTDPYARLDMGESWIRLDWPWISAGVSTAGMSWGPAERFPLTMGTNAPGFPHVFLGTGLPLSLWIGELHGRFVWGRLQDSEWAPPSVSPGRRFASSVVAVFRPARPEGLEVGGARFFHLPWREGGPVAEDFLRPFEAFSKIRIGFEEDPEIPENQVVSVFFRWSFAGSGLEVFGELYREDHPVDARDLLVEPDHDLASTLGLRKVWLRDSGEMYVFRAEVLDAKVSHLERVRDQVTPYGHMRLRQGHTHRGQILGTPAAAGGEGMMVAVDRYHANGRWTGRLERILREDDRNSATREGGYARDVAYALTAEALVMRGRWEILGEVTGVWNLNRNFSGDEANVRLGIEGRWRPD